MSSTGGGECSSCSISTNRRALGARHYLAGEQSPLAADGMHSACFEWCCGPSDSYGEGCAPPPVIGIPILGCAPIDLRRRAQCRRVPSTWTATTGFPRHSEKSLLRSRCVKEFPRQHTRNLSKISERPARNGSIEQSLFLMGSGTPFLDLVVPSRREAAGRRELHDYERRRPQEPPSHESNSDAAFSSFAAWPAKDPVGPTHLSITAQIWLLGSDCETELTRPGVLKGQVAARCPWLSLPDYDERRLVQPSPQERPCHGRVRARDGPPKATPKSYNSKLSELPHVKEKVRPQAPVPALHPTGPDRALCI